MRETKFIEQKKEKWEEMEAILKSPVKDPDRLSDLYVQVTDDLSYSRTFYPNRSVRVYLNNLAQSIFNTIYKNKKSPIKRFWYFWTDELPLLIHETKGAFRLAFIIFWVSFLIGALSSAMDPEFTRTILGDSYVDMTLKNIENGDPLAVYKEKDASGMALGIAFNNTFVAFLTFVFGAFFGVGSAGILIQNGVMVGSFQYFFIERGLFLESFLTVWLHGTLEISAIIIAGAAGLTMGAGLLFPGTLSRLQAFQISARRGIKIMTGIVPIILLAATIEGFLTRYTQTPDIIRGIFILLCLAFVLFYYVWLPRSKSKLAPSHLTTNKFRLLPDEQWQINYSHIKSSGEIFADSMIMLRKKIASIFRTAIGAALFYCLVIYTFSNQNASDIFHYFVGNSFSTALIIVPQYFNNEKIGWLLGLNTIIIAAVLYIVSRWIIIDAEENDSHNKPLGFIPILKAIVPAIIMSFLLSWASSAIAYMLILVVSFPILLMWYFVARREQTNLANAFVAMTNLLTTQFGNVIVLGILLTLFSMMLFFFSFGSFSTFIIEMIGWNIIGKEDQTYQAMSIFLTFFGYTLTILLLQLFIVSYNILYYSLSEIRFASSLRERVLQIAENRNLQGLDRE